MAEVYLPEVTSEDAYPRAPPPSPEMQPRNHNHVFEIPASKFEGMGLDLRRDTFPLDEAVESPLNFAAGVAAGGYADKRDNSMMFTRELDEEELLFSRSPQKRVCCSPGTLPVNLTTTVYPSSNHSSLASSGFGSFGTSLHGTLHHTMIPEEEGITVGAVGGSVLSHTAKPRSQSNSPPYFGIANTRTSPDVNSHLLTHSSCNHIGAAPLSTMSILQPPALLSDTSPLSRSCDFHSVHPHLPQSFETTQLPEVRPTRSRTLDATSSPTHDILRTRSHTLGASYAEEPVERKRKVSVKRKITDDSDCDDPSLQFSFEYSHSSTGSGVDSDSWVMVDCKPEPARPMEKKACCLSDSVSMAINSHPAAELAVLSASPFQGVSFPTFGAERRAEGEGLFASPLHRNHVDVSSQQPPLFGATPFAIGVTGERVATPTEQPVSMESMDCEGRMESLRPNGVRTVWNGGADY